MIVLFGSVANGTEDVQSDIDIAVLPPASVVYTYEFEDALAREWKHTRYAPG
jgi:predicted nucleotidyltransferase